MGITDVDGSLEYPQHILIQEHPDSQKKVLKHANH